MEAREHRGVVLAQAFDDEGAGLRDDDHRLREDHHHRQGDHAENDPLVHTSV
jgi:hypothetical protein